MLFGGFIIGVTHEGSFVLVGSGDLFDLVGIGVTGGVRNLACDPQTLG